MRWRGGGNQVEEMVDGSKCVDSEEPGEIHLPQQAKCSEVLQGTRQEISLLKELHSV